MSSIIGRLQSGKRWWTAEFVLRTAGLALLGLCLMLARGIMRLVNQPPPHQGSPLELAMAAMAFACLSAGLALFLEGPELFRPVPLPPRPLIY